MRCRYAIFFSSSNHWRSPSWHLGKKIPPKYLARNRWKTEHIPPVTKLNTPLFQAFPAQLLLQMYFYTYDVNAFEEFI